MTEFYSEEPKNDIEYFLQNDYGQHSAILIAKRFYSVVTRGAVDDFYKENRDDPIWSASEYLEQKANKLKIDVSQQKSSAIREQITKIDDIVVDIKEAIKLKKDLKEIYQIYLRFEKAGLRIKHINELEGGAISKKARLELEERIGKR